MVGGDVFVCGIIVLDELYAVLGIVVLVKYFLKKGDDSWMSKCLDVFLVSRGVS